MSRFIKIVNWALLFIISTYSYAQSADNTLRIALAGPFSGPYSGYGTLLLSGASQAVKDINDRGGIKGIHLEIIPIDDRCEPERAYNQAERIVKGKQFQAIIGHTCSSSTLATLETYAKANMLMITPTSTNPKITQKGIMTLFRMSGRDDRQALAAANFIVNKLNSKRIAILHDQDIYSKDLADYLSEYLVNMDTTPVLYQGIAQGTTNFKSLISKFKELEVDAVYFAGLYPEVGALAKAMHVYQLQIPLVSGDGIAINEFVDAAGGQKASTAVMMTFNHAPKDLKASQKVLADMKAVHLNTEGYSLYGYAAVQAIAQAIEQTDSTEGAVLSHWLHQNRVSTVLGEKSWDTNGDIIDSDYHIFMWGNEGQFNQIKLNRS